MANSGIVDFCNDPENTSYHIVLLLLLLLLLLIIIQITIIVIIIIMFLWKALYIELGKYI